VELAPPLGEPALLVEQHREVVAVRVGRGEAARPDEVDRLWSAVRWRDTCRSSRTSWSSSARSCGSCGAVMSPSCAGIVTYGLSVPPEARIPLPVEEHPRYGSPVSGSGLEEPLTTAARRQLAVGLFNHVWTLLELNERSPEQDDEMIHAAHASRFHWGEVGNGANLARGEWQVSRVYAVLGRAEPATFHARRCLAYVGTGDGTEDWDLPFAYEALARAHAVAGDTDESAHFEALARENGAAIVDIGDREHLLSELDTLPR
jgi:hypothetical protein